MLKYGLFLAIFAKEITNTALALVITTPAVDAPALCKTYRVMLAASHLDGLFGLAMEPEDPRGSAYILFVTNTKLAVVVEAPGEEHALVISVERGVTTTPDIDSLFGANLLNFA